MKKLVFIPPLVRRADTLLSLTQTYVTAYTGKETAHKKHPAHTNVSVRTNAPPMMTCHRTLSDQPLVSELRNAFGRSARTFPLLSDDLITDLLSQSTGYNSIIAREEEKIKPILKKTKNNISAVCTKSAKSICAGIQKLRKRATKRAIFNT